MAEIIHGTRTAYTKKKCRCKVCKEWNSSTSLRNRASRVKRGLPSESPLHGTTSGYTGYGCRCTPCAEANRDYKSLKYYGVSESEIRGQWVEQGKKCPLCLRDLAWEEVIRDHDHLTGKFRGPVCTTCNQAMGKFRDSPHLVERAIQYFR